MKISIKSLADKKWFVPLVIFFLLIVVVSSFSTDKDKDKDTYKTTEEQLEKICMAITGGEEATVMITYESSKNTSFFQDGSEKEIAGVAVICKGGEDPNIQLRIYDVIKSLFGIPSTRITVAGKY